jgi:hypothetical protein
MPFFIAVSILAFIEAIWLGVMVLGSMFPIELLPVESDDPVLVEPTFSVAIMPRSRCPGIAQNAVY